MSDVEMTPLGTRRMEPIVDDTTFFEPSKGADLFLFHGLVRVPALALGMSAAGRVQRSVPVLGCHGNDWGSERHQCPNALHGHLK